MEQIVRLEFINFLLDPTNSSSSMARSAGILCAVLAVAVASVAAKPAVELHWFPGTIPKLVCLLP